MDIKVDQSVAAQLAQQGITEKVGVYGEHKVQIGTGSPVRLDEIKGESIPFQGFRSATKTDRGKAGLAKSAAATLSALAAPGRLDVGRLLRALKTNGDYQGRLDKLGKLSEVQKQNALWMFAPAVERLSNAELAAVYQGLNSGEMTLLQTALAREGDVNAAANDARGASAQLFDLQALVLKEMSNRVSNGKLDDLIAQEPDPREKAELEKLRPKTLSEQYGGAAIEAVEHKGDITAANLHTLANVTAESATRRERSAAGEMEKLARRGMSATPREMGDVLRGSELTINIDTSIFMADDAFVLDAEKPLPNAFHRTQGGDSSRRNKSYMNQRKATEGLLFPELGGHEPVADERPIYAAINTRNAQHGAAARMGYGESVIVLKPEVARRATFIAEDTFYSPALTITAERRKVFYSLLAGSGLTTGTIDKIRNLTTEDGRKVVEAWFDSLAEQENLTAVALKRLPPELNLRDQNEHDNPENFSAVCLKAFGDPSATRAKMATYDNLESLLPGLDDLNGALLAEAAERHARKEDATMRFAMNYIEAQVQGPLVPGRDIQEIRIALDDIPSPAARAELISRMDAFHRQTGVKVVYFAYDKNNVPALPEGAIFEEDRADEDSSRGADVLEAGFKYFGEHILSDAQAALERACANLQDELRALVRDMEVADRFPATGDVLPPTGTFFRSLAARLSENLKADLQNPGEALRTPEMIARSTIDDTFRKALKRKAELIDKLATFEMNEAQRKAFTTWVLSSKVKTPEELEVIYTAAGDQASTLRGIAENDPPLSSEETFAALASAATRVDQRLDVYSKALPAGEEYGPDNRFADLCRSVSLGLTLLTNADESFSKPQIDELYARLNEPGLRALAGQLSAFVDEGRGMDHKAEKGFEMLNGLDVVLQETYRLAAQEVGKVHEAEKVPPSPPPPPTFDLNPSLVPMRARELFKEVSSPEFVEAMNRSYPPFDAFPTAETPLALPLDDASRRDFLLRHLDVYLGHERKFDPMGVHGRGHIARAYIFASAMCGILEERGIAVDRNAVLCGITAHDAGRQANGKDFWEEDSADLAVDYMRADFGEESTGADYEKAVRQSMTDKDYNTVERMVFQGADSLDIGRTQDLNLNLMPFLSARGDERMSPECRRLREGLAKEADLLQRLTNGLCARRDTISQLELQAMNAADPAETDRLMAQRQRERDLASATFEADRQLTSEAFFARVENFVRTLPDLFPILSKYYR